MRNLEQKLLKPDIQYRNDVRWWLAEGLHTDATLKNDIKMLDEAGFGAAEFLAMDEFGADSKRYGWGSEEFVHDTHTILEETTMRGMGASMTSGTNWSNANLITIVPDDKSAAKEITYIAETLEPGARYSKKLPRPEKLRHNVHALILIAVVASKIAGEENGRKILHRDGVVLTGQVKDEFLNWKAPDDASYELFTVWMHGTGQTASPSCAVNYTINYIDKYGTEALIDYWNEVVLTPALRKNILKNGRVQLYMDSLELTTFSNGGQFWGYHFMDEFKARRGYDLAPQLPLIFKKAGMMMLATAEYRYGCADADFWTRLKNDLYQTMTDMYMENVLSPIQTWLHSVGMTVRAEISYGLPFEISQPGKYVDGVETESLEFASQIDSYRGLAGTAHIYNRLFSSETGATLANYKKPIDFYTQIIFTQFAAGVARTVLHGYSSICGSEKATQWPGHEGMWPIFSERFGVRQPAFRHYNDWNGMIARYQYLLRQGKPRMDLGILRLDYAFNNMVMMAGGEDHVYEHALMRGNKGLYWQNTDLQNAGYTYDYFAPQLLNDAGFDGTVCPDGPGYQALVVYQGALSLPEAKLMRDWAKKGLKIVFVNGVTETLAVGMDVTHEKAAARTPFNDGGDAELAVVVAEMQSLPSVATVDGAENALPALKKLGVEPRVRFAAPNRNVLPFLRADGDNRYAYFYNCMYTEKEPVLFTAELEGEGVPYWIDCWTGKVEPYAQYEARDGRTLVALTLNPGQACMVGLDLSEKPGPRVVETDASFAKFADGKLFLGARKSGAYVAKLADGTARAVQIDAPADVDIPLWHLKVEDWDAGEKVEITEDRGQGYVSKEVYYETKKTLLDAGQVALKPWKDIPGIGEDVSGVGFYTAEFALPDAWGPKNIAKLEIGSTNGQTCAVYVNGVKTPGVDFDRPEIDITALVKPGNNTISVDVSSTLTNRLRARGYFAGLIGRFMELMSESTAMGEMNEGGDNPLGPLMAGLTDCAPQEYGMTGFARIATYTLKEV
jgi:hypothetical protein